VEILTRLLVQKGLLMRLLVLVMALLSMLVVMLSRVIAG